jgi:DNA-binding LytR/AlgR family response regulator
MNVKTILSHLPDKLFYRINKSYIINVDKIDTVETDFVNVAGEEIPIGSSYKEAFLNNIIKGKLIKR